MSFQVIFTDYWNQAITGFIGGLIFYIMTLENSKIFGVSLKNKFVRAIYAFLVGILLTTIYSAFVYLLR